MTPFWLTSGGLLQDNRNCVEVTELIQMLVGGVDGAVWRIQNTSVKTMKGRLK